MRSEPLNRVIEAAGSASELARRIGVRPSAVLQWVEVPPLRVPAVAAATGLPRHVIRPDLYDAPEAA